MSRIAAFNGWRDSLADLDQVGYEVLCDRRATETVPLTIAIPTFRRPHLLRNALQSVAAQSRGRPFDVLVIDNDQVRGDVDDVVAEFRTERIALVRNAENIGLFGNWNRCIQLARTPWVTILNDDDLIGRDFVALVMSEIKPNTSFVAVGKPTIKLGEFEQAKNRPLQEALRAVKAFIRLAFTSDRVTVKRMFEGNIIGNSTGCVFNRKLAIRAGGFDPLHFPSSDYVFWVRLLTLGEGRRLNRTGAYYRVGLNESLKCSVLSGLLERDFEIRADIAEHLSGPEWLKRYVLSRQFFVAAEDYLRKWNPECEFGGVAKSLRLTRPRFLLGTRATSWAIGLMLRPRRAALDTAMPRDAGAK